MFGLLQLILGVPFYFLPTLLGWKRRNPKNLFLLNLVLGWTLIGWVGLLVWSTWGSGLSSHFMPKPPPEDLNDLQKLQKEVEDLKRHK